jgi:hypothetical protein
MPVLRISDLLAMTAGLLYVASARTAQKTPLPTVPPPLRGHFA